MFVGEDTLKLLGEDAKEDGEVLERLLVLRAHDLHVLVGDCVDADVTLLEMVVRKDVH